MDIANNALSNLQSWFGDGMFGSRGAIFVIAYLIGFLMVAFGIYEVAKANKGGRASLGKGIASIVVGSLLASLPAFLDSLSITLFNTPSASSLVSDSAAGAVTGASGEYAAAAALFFAVTQLVGLYAVIKGLRLLRDSAEDHTKSGPAWTHVIGGIFALNIITVLGMVGATLGTSVASIINQIIGGIS